MAKAVRPVNREYTELVLIAPKESCEVCGKRLWITQHRGRSIERLDGLYVLTMKDKRCGDKACRGRARIFRAPDELMLALSGDTVGLDVLFEIGERRLQDDMTFASIHRLLRGRGVQVCEKTVHNAFERFVALASCRSGESDEAKKELRAQGGIVLLVDGVQFDDHSPVLYIASDAISGRVLFAERHDGRSAKALQPLLERVKAMGVPVLGVVSDKEKGLVPAIQAVFPAVPYQFCQLHFVKRCAKALDKPLAKLGEEIDETGKKIRALRREVEQARAPRTPSESAERTVVEGLLVAAHAATKVSGRAPYRPPALIRDERLRDVEIAAKQAAKKGGAGSFSSVSRRS